MKKVISLILSVLMILSMLAACSSAPAATEAPKTETEAPATEAATEAPAEETTAEPRTFRVAIVQQLDHASLDEIRFAIEAQLDALAAEKGIIIEYKEFNGQNDQTILSQIGTQVVDDGFNAIIPIATLAAQMMATAAEDTSIPVIYAAISDPEAAGLVDLANVTGTSDALNTPFILDMMLAAQPDIETVGLLYSKSEDNSITPIAEAKAYLDEKGIPYVEKTGNSTDEILPAASEMVGRVQAVFTPTDNVVMAAEGAVAEILNEAGIAHYTGADSFVAEGAFTTSGVNYTELGTYTATMTVDILLGADIPVYHVMEGGIITVNTDTAAALGIDYAVFKDMAGTVVEVANAE